MQKHPTLNFRLHNIAVDLIAQIRVGPEHLDLQFSVHVGYHPIDVRIIHPEAAEGKYFSTPTPFVRSHPSGSIQSFDLRNTSFALALPHDRRPGQNSGCHLQFVQILAAEICSRERCLRAFARNLDHTQHAMIFVHYRRRH